MILEAPPKPETPDSLSLLVERLDMFEATDLADLCEATDAAILEGGGFGWVEPPGRQALENYYKGVLLVPERELFVARLNGHVVGSAQLVRPPRNNEAQAFAAQHDDEAMLLAGLDDDLRVFAQLGALELALDGEHLRDRRHG